MTEPPVEPPEPGKRHATSLVLVFTGDGKGKTTAAMGTMLRALARGWNVCVVQFIKSGEWRTGEEAIARSLGVDWQAAGEGFTWDSNDLGKAGDMAKQAWLLARDRIDSGAYELVVLDEATYPMTWGWIPTDEVANTIRGRPEQVNVIVTGREAPAEIVELADTVTEMVNVRHAYESGFAARRGIDF